MISPLGSGIDIFLQPGDWYWAEGDVRIRTTLGSCVAVCLWHPQRKVGGMCHYMLPRRPKTHSENALDGRYGDEAFMLLYREVVQLRTPLSEYEVKLFGGANMFAMKEVDSPTVATHNIAIIRAWVQEHQLTVTSESLGGTCYRQLLFDISSGDVWVRLGVSSQRSTIAHKPGV